MSAVEHVVIIDDEASVRAALASVLITHGFEVSTFDSSEAFLSSATIRQRGCVVADIRMPGMGGMKLLEELVPRRASLPVILITGHGDVRMAVAAIKAGAHDFIEKPIDDEELVASIRASLVRVADQSRARSLVDELRARQRRLSGREAEVMNLVVAGCTSPVIAQRLAISQRTVEHHRAQVMQKMEATSLSQLVKMAITLGEPT